MHPDRRILFGQRARARNGAAGTGCDPEPDHIHGHSPCNLDHHAYTHADGTTHIHTGETGHLDPFQDTFPHSHGHEASNENTARADTYAHANTDSHRDSYANLHTHFYDVAFANAIEYSQPNGYGISAIGPDLSIATANSVAWPVDETEPQ